MFTKRSKREKEISNTTFLYVQNIHSSFNMILFKAKRKLACNKTEVTIGQTDQRKKRRKIISQVFRHAVT